MKKSIHYRTEPDGVRPPAGPALRNARKGMRFTALSLAGLVVLTALAGCGAGASKDSGALSTADITEAAAETEAYEVQSDYEASYENMANGEDGGSPKSISEKYQLAYGADYQNSEEYHAVTEQGFRSVSDHPLSTFSVDVDTASYGNIRRMIVRGQEVPADAVRIEEMINYFRYDYEQPSGNEPFSVNTELSDCPWNPDSQLLLVGLQAKDIDFQDRPMANLVFLLDVSGSMYDEDKLPLVQKSFSLLTDELTENDRVSIVTYAGYEQVVLDGAGGAQKEKIRDALNSLTAGGSTAGEAGINRAYELAEQHFIEGGNNRVILATDGDLNVGVSSEEGLTRLIEDKRQSGVHLSVLGFGTGNLKDNKMEALADHGDGNYHYIDSLKEAKKVLVEEMGGTLVTVAKDVKLQLEFNPAQVKGYRLIGYENRALADEDFQDDSVDAGEIGAGHRVTALYELLRAGTDSQNLRYQESAPPAGETQEYADELLTVNIRYKAPSGGDSSLMSAPVKAAAYTQSLPDNLRFASAVAEFGMLLRDSEYKGDSSYQEILELIAGLPDSRMDDYKAEFRQLVLRVSDR